VEWYVVALSASVNALSVYGKVRNFVNLPQVANPTVFKSNALRNLVICCVAPPASWHKADFPLYAVDARCLHRQCKRTQGGFA
jgi:hypothetical protein